MKWSAPFRPLSSSAIRFDDAPAKDRVGRCLHLACAVTRRRFPVGASPTRQPLQPEAIGAVTEVTKWLKPSISVSRIGDSASVQAATRVNAEQASKRTMCRPTRLPYRGRLKWLGALSEDYAHLLRRGIGGSMYTRKSVRNTGSPKAWSAMTNRKPAKDRSGALRWRRGLRDAASRCERSAPAANRS
jgi:hypothetical protein